MDLRILLRKIVFLFVPDTISHHQKSLSLPLQVIMFKIMIANNLPHDTMLLPVDQDNDKKPEINTTFPQFNKWPSIENIDSSATTKFFEKCTHAKNENQIWLATEKIHGANFSITTNGLEIRCAKRTGVLDITDSKDNFYQYQNVVARIKPNLFKFYNMLVYKETICDEKSERNYRPFITIFGELFGGSYPGTNPKQEDLPVTRVQKGVFYSPRNEFIIFGVKNEDASYWYSILNFETIATQAGLLVVPLVAKGTFDQVIKEIGNIELLETRVPQLLGLPRIDNNFAEGAVLSMYTQTIYGDKQIPNGTKGHTIKYKRKLFRESKIVQDKKPKNTTRASPFPLAQIAQSLICHARLMNVVSKLGEWKLHTSKEWAEFLIQDAMDDFIKEHAGEIISLFIEWDDVRKYMARVAYPLCLSVKDM